jgi:RNA polymerase sigma-70 factor (ECF subfamily)
MSPELEQLVRGHGPFVWRVLRHLGVPADQLEDLSQEVFLVVVRKGDGFRGESAFSTWLYGVCRNVTRQARRTRARRRENVHAEPPESGVAEMQSRIVARKQAWRCIERELQILPEPTRMVFVLFELEQMDMDHVAQTVGCGISTAYSRLYAARAQVRSALERADLIESAQAIAEVV